MCGIVALLSPQRAISRGALERATTALSHRGPDGRGARVLHGGRVALGHTRLALVDPAGGAQPITNEDESVVAVVSGELYDDARLRRDLEARGHRFRTRSDSELCVHLYEEHGEALVDFMRGEFAFALWDERRAKLVCGRDRFGVRPLCWTRLADGSTAIASEAKALFALGAPVRWSDEALLFATSAQYVPEDATLFEGVAQLRPGHLLVADAAGVVTRRYWDLHFARAEDKRPVSREELRGAVEEAVTVRLRGDAPVACQLSGGLDSSLVAAIAARATHDALDCFTISFEGPREYDEIEIAARTARAIGAELHPVRVGARALWDALPAAVASGEGLAINLHLSAKFLLSRAVRGAGHRVVLTGEGADEVFGGYAHLRRDLLLERGASETELAAANRASAGIMLPEAKTPDRQDALDTRGASEVLGFVPSWLQAKAALGRRVTSLLAPELRRRFATRDPYREIAASFDEGALRGRERIDRSSYTWCKLALANYILRTLGDGMEMAHSIEGRLPFLDHELFALARVMPTEQRVARSRIEKHALREVARGLVPEEVIERRKHPLLAPPLLADDSPMQDWLRSASVPAFVDRAALLGALDAAARAPSAERQLWDPAFMTIATATLLGQHYRVGTS